MTLSHVEAQFLSLGHGLLKFTQHQFGSIWILGGEGAPYKICVHVFQKEAEVHYMQYLKIFKGHLSGKHQVLP